MLKAIRNRDPEGQGGGFSAALVVRARDKGDRL